MPYGGKFGDYATFAKEVSQLVARPTLDRWPGGLFSQAEVTIAAFSTLPISQHTEQFIIQALRAAKALTLSLVAEMDGRVVGHIAFSPVTISDGAVGWYGLGPLSVLPNYQKLGIGTALVTAGLSLLRNWGGQGAPADGAHPAPPLSLFVRRCENRWRRTWIKGYGSNLGGRRVILHVNHARARTDDSASRCVDYPVQKPHATALPAVSNVELWCIIIYSMQLKWSCNAFVTLLTTLPHILKMWLAVQKAYRQTDESGYSPNRLQTSRC